jgi:NitT/TauT family transport system substrate-binding protein
MNLARVFLVTSLFSMLALVACQSAAPSSPPAPTAAAASTPVSAATVSSTAAGSIPTRPAATVTGTQTSAPEPQAKPAAASSTSEPTTLIASYSELTPINLPTWIAKEQGFFDKNGLNVDIRLLESSLGVSALLAGDEQFAAMGGSETLAAVLNGADLVVLACFSPVYPYKLEVASSIKTAQDLKGKKLGISRFGSSSDSATRAALKQLGLDPEKDVTLVQVGSLAARTAALLSGALDGAVDALPDTLNLEAHGFHPLLDLAAQELPAVNNVLVTTGAFATNNATITQKYVDAIVQGVARAKSDKSLSIQLTQKYLGDRGGDANAVAAAYDYDIGEVMKIPPIVKPQQFKDALSQLATKNAKAKDFDVGSIIDNTFVESAVARGLGNTN